MSGVAKAIGNLFSPPKPDNSAILMQERALEEQRGALEQQRAALTQQQEQNARREADMRQREEVRQREQVRRRARAAMGRNLLVFADETGVPGTQSKLGG
jgi:hypothetical protein